MTDAKNMFRKSGDVYFDALSKCSTPEEIFDLNFYLFAFIVVYAQKVLSIPQEFPPEMFVFLRTIEKAGNELREYAESKVGK